MAWRVAPLIASAPLLFALCTTLWRTPYPINEAVALFEDVAKAPPSAFLIPESSYYRPMFHLSLMAIWRHAGRLDARLAGVKLLHVTPVAVLVVLLPWCLRPRDLLEAVAAAIALLVLIGSPGFRDNLEIPLSYTAVGMPIALAVWRLLEDEARRRTTALVIALALIAVGFKEQGLVLVPVVLAARWMRAPGASRALTVTLVVFAAAYLVLRLLWSGRWPLFEQSMGLGFSTLEPREAAARFGAFPYWMYAYNSASTMANVLFAEPTAGLFFFTRALWNGAIEPWYLVHLASSAGVTACIAWWGVRVLRAERGSAWSTESRTFVALLVALVACGALSFNYSRDRLGGMAAVYYALAAYFAIRAVAAQAIEASPERCLATGLTLCLLASLWSLRAVGTVEWTRRTAFDNQARWLTQLVERREEFADRPVYLGIMREMVDQGTAPGAPWPTRYPRYIGRWMGPP